ncbi:adenine deaminase [Feifania hominis]|uniref:Adenine deaminase n=1 Tax=Feifania hominis TaxID=2763660 RepID=A0A926DEW2_9FIRM|nr:adenine deaminase C-terminal domain-containing protein [Feifania hominis]MBC8536577.1 adenine deaminase [Feifania hominis]
MYIRQRKVSPAEVGKLTRRIRVAQKLEQADLLIKNARVVNVFTREVLEREVAVADGIICGLYAPGQGPDAASIVDADGRYLLPGLIDAHTHVEMAYVTATRFAEAILPWGTTTVMIDPHDTSNVMGNEGIGIMAHEMAGLPIKTFYNTPPCVPSAPTLEDAGFSVTLDSLSESADLPLVAGVAETMDFGRVLSCEDEMMRMLTFARQNELLIDGHAPGVLGDAANAYFGAGPIRTDHESVTVEEMLEKYELGVHVIIRRGSLSEPASAGEFVSKLRDTSRVLLATDGCISPSDIVARGHMNFAMAQVVAEGVDPMVAVQMGTINVARAYRIDHRVGAVAPGYEADMVLVDDLKDFRAHTVFVNGKKISRGLSLASYQYPANALKTIRLEPITPEDLAIPAEDGAHTVNVIGMIDGTVATTLETETMQAAGGAIAADASRDLLKTAVFERYGRGKGHSVGIVRGFGMKRGAIAGSIGQDTQNMAAVGASDADMAAAVNAVIEMQGGVALVADGELLARVSMPVFGIMSDKPIPEVARELEEFQRAYESLGGTLSDAVFTLSLQLTLAVIPDGGISNRGLVRVADSQFIPVVAD